MAGGHNKGTCCSEAHLQESSLRSIDLSWAAGLSLRRGLRHTIAWERRVLGALPQRAAPWLAVASHRCANKPCITSVRIALRHYFITCYVNMPSTQFSLLQARLWAHNRMGAGSAGRTSPRRNHCR